MNLFAVGCGLFQLAAACYEIRRGDWRMALVWACLGVSNITLGTRKDTAA